MLDAQHALELARSDFHHAIRRLHAAGATMREIATAFGLSHQRVHQIVGEDEEDRPRPFPAPSDVGPRVQKSKGRRRGMFQRFTEPARTVVAAAEDEARGLGHSWVGTEHLLLGIAGSADERATRLLAGAGLDLEELRREVASVAKPPSEAPRSRRSFARGTKKVLELALREALALGDNFIGVEHILIAIARDKNSVAAKILAAHGLDAEALRERLEDAA
jgi:predicted transcriptional regulator